jgi:anti-sigma-K factor RskA
MTHEVIKHLLDDYVTGELNEDARAPVEEHVATCAMCTEEVRSLKRVLERAADLPKSIDPPAEAWSNIRTAILREENAVKSVTRPGREHFWNRRFALVAAAAAVLVAVLSSSGTAWYLSTRSPRDVVSREPRTASRWTLAAYTEFTIEENNYLRTVADLQTILDQQESVLAPETVAQLKSSLRTIDEAILEARTALARDPSNKVLIDMVSSGYKQKVDLLKRSTEMTRGS